MRQLNTYINKATTLYEIRSKSTDSKYAVAGRVTHLPHIY